MPPECPYSALLREGGCQGAERRDGLGVWDERMQTVTHRMDKQQGPTI